MTRLAPILCAWLVLIGLTISTTAATEPRWAPAATRPTLTVDVPIHVSGTGKVLDFGGLTLVHRGHNTGVAPWIGGGAIRVRSVLGEPQAKRPKGATGLWANPRGTVATLLNRPGQYGELAPLSHRMTPGREWSYQWYPILDLADRVTVRNLTVRVTNQQADGSVWLDYARRPTISGLRVEYAENVKGGLAGAVNVVGCGWPTLRDISGPITVAVNSTHDLRADGLRVAALTFEECSTDAEVADSTIPWLRTNDSTCRRLTFAGCAFGQVWLIGGVDVTFEDCTWASLYADGVDGLTVRRGTGPRPVVVRSERVSIEE